MSSNTHRCRLGTRLITVHQPVLSVGNFALNSGRTFSLIAVSDASTLFGRLQLPSAQVIIGAKSLIAKYPKTELMVLFAWILSATREPRYVPATPSRMPHIPVLSLQYNV